MMAFVFLSAWLFISPISCQRQAAPPTYQADIRELIAPTSDGRPVMTDGIFQTGEWDDAATLTVNDSVSLYFKQYREHFYIALDGRKLLVPTIDLYLSSDSLHVHQLHVSAQLAERLFLLGQQDSSDTVWVPGRTSGWYANEFRWIYGLQDSLVNIEGMTWADAIVQTSFPHEAIEIDILQSKIGGAPWFFRVEVWTARTDELPLAYPAATTSDDFTNWATLTLNW